ncbi:small nuclear ribonucleoprotein G [Pancytospora philotis]|nr:small nuclear ribonucleoprotein G [Pancytospora philotis]
MEDTEMYRKFVDKKVQLRYCGDAFLVGMCRAVDGYLNVVVEDACFYEKPGAEPVSVASCYVRGGALRHIETVDG